VSGLAYLLIFAIPLAQKTFMLDPSNMATTSIALGIGLVGAAIIEVVWWVQGALLGERRRLWRTS
jgi:cation-transporting P-type ATPase E